MLKWLYEVNVFLWKSLKDFNAVVHKIFELKPCILPSQKIHFALLIFPIPSAGRYYFSFRQGKLTQDLVPCHKNIL